MTDTVTREGYDQIVAAALANGWTRQTSLTGLSPDQQRWFLDGRLVRYTKAGRSPVTIYWNLGGYLCVGGSVAKHLRELQR
jgi:hypothetical protein